MADTQKPNRNNRKRKKTFLQNARKYAKKGYYGRGTKLDEDTYQYFVRIMEAYREGFPSEEEKLIFANNVFDQTENEEINCACNQVGCRVIETLLPFANDEVMTKYMKVFGDELRPMCSDRFASHVIEALLKESTTRALKTGDENYTNFTMKISKFLLNNMEDYMWDTYGNHTLRAVLHNLSQIPKEDNKPINNNKKTPVVAVEDITVPDDYKEVVQDYAQRLITWPQFNELPLSELTSGFLQVLLKALAKLDVKLLATYVKRLIDDCFTKKEELNEGALPPVFMSKPNMMLLETVLQVATPKLYTKIYGKCFSGNIKKLACMRITNFAVQKLFAACVEKSEFEAMFDELEEGFKEVLDAGHSGVLLALGQGCKRLAAKQGSFIQNIMKALNCHEPQNRQDQMVLCLSKMVTFEELPSDLSTLEKDKLNLHGTLMLQLMLEFNKPIKVINGILNTDTNVVKGLFCNSMGSHIVDSYVKSAFVGEKSREKLVRKMKGTYQDMAASKYGSRSFEAIWNAANMKMKLNIMDELKYKDALWCNTEFGKIIAGKINLQLYKRSPEDWKNAKSETKERNLMEEVLGT